MSLFIHRRSMVLVFAAAIFLLAPSAFAGFIDFEDGTDGAVIASTIDGLEFTTTMGYDWIYGDWREGYNGPYPNGSYYSDGNFFAWLGPNQGSGVITFTLSFATYLEIGYSSSSYVYLEAYDVNDVLLDSDMGDGNTGTGVLDYLRVDSPDMAYVIVHDTGNYWLIDNLSTDAVYECTEDAHCDDGVFCNGAEACVQYQCQEGTPLDCSDDGAFCNGNEYCSELDQACAHTGWPCAEDSLWCNGWETCDEEIDACVSFEAPCSDDGIFLNGTEGCDELIDECTHSGNPVWELCPCDDDWKNHGKYVSCVAHVCEGFLDEGYITEEEKDELVSTAAQSDCGKKK